jgi:SAM-dependent methyltransferase
VSSRHTPFPAGFFARQDESDDAGFYSFDRFVTHIDDGAIAAVGELYDELGLTSAEVEILDICSSWISHLPTKPGRLVVTGMNSAELEANKMADEWSVQDLNADPSLTFDEASFDAVTCAVSVDYLSRPLDVFAEAARVLRPGGLFVCTFSNRCFPTKAIRGWLSTDDRGRRAIVATYFDLTDGFGEPVSELRNPDAPGDPLYAVWARRD